MLQVETFTFNPFSENTYIVYSESGDAIIIDPGMFNDFEVRQVENFLKSNSLKLQAIVNTHTHIDHIFGVNYMKSTYKVPFIIHEADQIILDNAQDSARRFGFELEAVPSVDQYIQDTYKIGNDELKVLFTPGHSPGSVSFYYPEAQWVISGDVLFNGSIGRTDLPLGSFETLKASIIDMLYVLPENTTVYSGHGPLTTIKDEKYSNPFVHL